MYIPFCAWLWESVSGPCQDVLGKGHLQHTILLELSSGNEWIFFIGILSITLCLIT
jgi:hypothetical protein